MSLRVHLRIMWDSPESEFGSTLVFRSLRVGFPTAEIVVHDNGSAPENREKLDALAARVGATVIHGPVVNPGVCIENIIKCEAAAGRREPIVFCDTDMTFYESVERTPVSKLFAGPYVPEAPLVDGRMAERVYPCLFWVADPVAAAEMFEKWERRFFLHSVLEAQVVRDERGLVLYDTLAALFSLEPDAFERLEWTNAFTHMGLGTRPSRLEEAGLAPGILAAVRETHEAIRGEQPARWKPPAGNVRWLYGSGLLDGDDGRKYPVFAATFWAATSWEPVSHIGVLDLDTGKFWPAVVPGPPGNLEVVPGDEGWRFDIPMSDGGTQRRVSQGAMAGTVLVGDRAVQVSGPAWVEEEGGMCGDQDFWVWVSVRLDDGRRIMFSEANGTGTPIVARWKGRKYLGECPGTLKPNAKWTSPSGADYGTAWTLEAAGETYTIVAAAEDQKVSDPDCFGIAYWEGFCRVYRDGVEVGHAWVEQLRPGWDVPDKQAEYTAMAMMGDPDAIEFAKTLAAISQVADDYADGDRTGAKWMVELLSWVAFDLQKNPFYQKHRAELDPVLEMGLLFYEASDEWKLSPRRETRMYGFVYREVLEMGIARAAMILGGRDHARKVIRGMHDIFHVKRGDSFEAWEAQENAHGR